MLDIIIILGSVERLISSSFLQSREKLVHSIYADICQLIFAFLVPYLARSTTSVLEKCMSFVVVNCPSIVVANEHCDIASNFVY